MEQRQALKDRNYFIHAIANRQRYVDELKEDIRVQRPNLIWHEVYNQLYENLMGLFLLSYTLGVQRDVCKTIAIEAITYYLKRENDPDFESDSVEDYIGVYEDCLRVTSLALLFCDDDSILHQLKTLFDTHKIKDALLDHLLAQRITISKPAKKLSYPKVYSAINEVFLLTKDKQPEAIAAYLEQWYKLMKSTGWHNTHKKPNVDASFAFEGYWALEVAAVVALLTIDDSSFRTMGYYPAELVS